MDRRVEEECESSCEAYHLIKTWTFTSQCEVICKIIHKDVQYVHVTQLDVYFFLCFAPCVFVPPSMYSNQAHESACTSAIGV